MLLGDQVKNNGIGGTCGTHGRQEKNVTHLVGRPDVKRQFGRHMSRQDNIKQNLQELGWRMGWIDLAHDRDIGWGLVDAVIHLRFS